MRAIHVASLTSLAILKVNWDKGQDYIQNFVPFVAEAVRRADQDEVSIVEIQKIIRDEFGLVIPQGALVTLLHRAERSGIVKKAHGIYVRNSASIDPTFVQTRADFIRQQGALVEKLIAFCAEKHDVTLTGEEAEHALLGHLQNSCIPLLAAAVDGCAIPPPEKKVQHAEFLVSSFTIALYEKDPVGFGFLETVMKGSMLANALFMPDIAHAKRKFEKLSVYLDTPILLRALGLEDSGLETSTKELLTLLYELNVDLLCFEETKDEIRRILEAAQHALRNPNFGGRHPFSVHDYLLKVGATASDVELVIVNLERSLRRVRVAIRPAPPHAVHLGLDEMRFEHIMREEMPTQREEARPHDLNCLTAVHRLRNGAPKYGIETCGHLFVTPNNGLAVTASRFTREQHGASTVPLCVNDHTMATLAWVKNPTLVADFSRHRLLADSYAALRLGSELWRKYLDEITRLQRNGNITEQDADLLRVSTTVKTTLVELTLGNPDVFTQGTVQEILARAQAEARRGTEVKLAQETQKRESAEQTARAAGETLAAALMSQRARLAEIGELVGRWVTRATFLIASIMAVLGFVLTLPLGFSYTTMDWWIRTGAAVVICVFAAFAIWSLLTGGSVREVSRKLEVWTAKMVEKSLKQLLHVTEK